MANNRPNPAPKVKPISIQDAMMPLSPNVSVKLRDISAVSYGQDPTNLSRFVEVMLTNGEKLAFTLPSEEVQHEFYKTLIAFCSGMLPPDAFTKIFTERFVLFVPSSAPVDPEEEENV